MSKELYSQISELTIHTPGVSNNFCDTFIFEPSSTEKKLGYLLILLEVSDIDNSAPQLSEILANKIKEEYYRDPLRPPLESFEAGLHQANVAISEFVQQGHTEWMGKLHCLIAASTFDVLHVASTGKARALLFRHGQITDISEGLADRSAKLHPLKTFTNITSGNVLLNDYLLLASPEIFHFVSFERLKRLFSFLSPQEITQKFKELFSAGSKESSLAAMVIKFSEQKQKEEAKFTKESAPGVPSFLPPAYHPPIRSTVAPKEERSVKKNTVSRFTPVLWSVTKKTAQTSWKVTQKTILPATQSGIKLLWHNTKRVSALAFRRSKEFLQRKKASAESATKEPKAISPAAPPSIPPIEKKPSLLSNLSKFKFSSLSQKIKNLPLTLRHLNHTSKILLILVIIFALLFVGSLFLLKQKRQHDAEIKRFAELLEQARRKEEAGSTALIYKDENKARGLFQEAQEIIDQVKVSGYYQDEAGGLAKKLQEELDKTNHVVRIKDLETIGNFGEVLGDNIPSRLLGLKENLYVYNSANNAIFRLQTQEKRIENVSSSSSGIGYFKEATVLTPDKMIVFLTDSPGLAQFDAKTKDLTKLDVKFPADGEYKDLANFGNRIYVLDIKKNRLLGFSKTLSGYAGGEDWLKEKDIKLAEVADFGIDGYVYFLLNNGKIEKYLKGVKKEFNEIQLQVPLKNPAKLFVQEGIKHLYILDPENKRVVVLDTLGNLYKQYFFENTATLKDFYITEKEEEMYLLDAEGVVKKIKLEK